MNRSCAVCGSDRFHAYRSLQSHLDTIPVGLDRGFDASVRIERCLTCGLLRTDEVGTPQALYEEQSISLEASQGKATQFRNRDVYSQDELSFVRAPVGRLLDVGCSTGYFLAKARAAGWDVVGTELDHRAAQIARSQFGVDVHCGPLQQVPFKESEFHAITLWGVLEHLPDPFADLQFLRGLLRPDGVMVAGVPNVASLNCALSALSSHGWDMFLEPGHLYHFRHSTLSRLGKRAGLDLVASGTMTCAIRGKMPFIPGRWPVVERCIDEWDLRYPPFRFAYRAVLRLLDAARLGDILVATFKKQRDT